MKSKTLKNRLVVDRTPGTEDLHPEILSGDHGLTLTELAPWGVIGAVTPSTNPAATIINNGISMIAAGNGVVFGAHPLAKKRHEPHDPPHERARPPRSAGRRRS